MDEQTLFHAYDGTRPVDPEPVVDRRSFALGRLVFRPCTCGGWLGIDERRPEESFRVATEHLRTARHMAYRRQLQWGLVWASIRTEVE